MLFWQPGCPAKNCITVGKGVPAPAEQWERTQKLDSLWMMELKENRGSAKRDKLRTLCYLRNVRLTPEFLSKPEVKTLV